MAKSHSIEERFWSKVRRGGPDECWIWTACRGFGGYGVFYAGRQFSRKGTVPAHRMAWFFQTGQLLRKPFEMCHHCDNPPCVNPAHLFVGTRSDNMKDCAAKGRRAHQLDPSVQVRGSRCAWAKLTEADVVKIRLSKERTGVLAKRYGVNVSTVRAARSGRTKWKHVPFPVDGQK